MAKDNIEVLGLDPKASVVEAFNQANDTQLKNDDALLSTTDLAEDNAEGVLSVRRKQSVFDQIDYAGRAELTWKRLDLGMFFPIEYLEIPIALPATTLDLLAELERRTGLRINADDVVLEQILNDEVASNYTLKARETSLRWYGEIAIDASRLISLPKKIPPGTQLGSLGEEADPEGWVIDFGGDLNGNLFAPLFKTTEIGTRLSADTPELVQAFQNILLAPNSLARWAAAESVSVQNLWNATVTYNDVTPGHIPGHYNQTLTHAIRILLDSFYCSTPVGIITIYYNPDFTPGTEHG